MGGQLIEIGGTELQALSVLKGEKPPTDEEVRAMIRDLHDSSALTDFVNSVRTQTLEYLDGLNSEQLHEEVEFPAGWHESIGLPSIPRAEAFRGIAQHEAYHTGQLVSYLWARGDNPYKWK